MRCHIGKNAADHLALAMLRLKGNVRYAKRVAERVQVTLQVSPTDYHRIGERPLCARGLNRSRGKALWRATEPTQLAHCRAMAAFCRQRVAFENENENDAFWIREAEAQSLLLVIASRQRLGDVFMARAGGVHGKHVRIASKREPQMRQSSRSPLDWGVFVFEGARHASRCDRCGLWD
jgi:hypothetical protein